MSEMDALFPLPDGRRNADDMGMPAPVCRECERLRKDLAAAQALLREARGEMKWCKTYHQSDDPHHDRLAERIDAALVKDAT
jgi:hypothetical protein